MPKEVDSSQVPKEVDSSRVPREVDSSRVPRELDSSQVSGKAEASHEPREAGASQEPWEMGSSQEQGRTPEGSGITSSRLRWILILGEAALVLGLLGVVVLSEEVSTSNSLWVLFFYSFPSEFLVGLVPHEPILIAFGETYPPWIVALVSVIGTVMAEGLNYSFFGLFYGIPSFREVFERESVKKIADLFEKMPFSAILFAGFTPVPFFPVRFLVVITGYPVWKYLLAVFLSRGPRFYLLALFGAFFEVPGFLLIGLFVGIFFLVNLPAVIKVLRS